MRPDDREAAKGFAIGDPVYYVLPIDRANGRLSQQFLPAVIVNITSKRIVIRLEGSRNHRNVFATSLALRVSVDVEETAR